MHLLDFVILDIKVRQNQKYIQSTMHSQCVINVLPMLFKDGILNVFVKGCDSHWTCDSTKTVQHRPRK